MPLIGTKNLTYHANGILGVPLIEKEKQYRKESPNSRTLGILKKAVRNLCNTRATMLALLWGLLIVR